MTPRALDDADRGPGQVERRRVHEAGVLGGLASHERATRLTTAGRDPTDQFGDSQRIQPSDRDVVEEREGLGAGADDVVGAHRDEVDADGVEPTDERRRPRSWSRRRRSRRSERFAVAGRDAERPAEPTEATDDLRPRGGRHMAAASARRPVRRPPRRHRRVAR